MSAKAQEELDSTSRFAHSEHPGAMAAGSRPLATVVRSGIMRTTAKHRPAPSILTLPGVRQQPWFDSKCVIDCRGLPPQRAGRVVASHRRPRTLVHDAETLRGRGR